ncbi:putative SNAP25 homologous protein SNAP30 [Rhododendron vialii]|uniref:putative SNAP25 homologous protein SNAP30 n=1 Tax=Rhododendron vialii TaxID=182163 RepID=UPI00265F76E1|nr:putative SNAP25 homologous protein SNAP30 [Rhododendron vialii]XP_058193645.1 putative SNAP25 homologous protein SNAP30 [Rhododendron vialii]XP_058193646.1 putative SNAP25 homologous protein SNAP30 [Rhododendron vialii]XP_058193647.1 putative SNAP25 homologous protein SNAP30 [Rhododendron vialii]
MFGFMKSPGNKVSNPSSSNPFHSDTESDAKRKIGRRTSSEPVLLTPNCKSNPFDDDDDGRKKTVRNKHKKGYSDSEDLDGMSVQELESYAVNRAEDTSKSVNNCLKIAEDIRQDATRTLDTLHQQGEQIHRTHVMATDMDKDLQKGEKLLGNLGGMFSMPWKPKKTRDISGPVISKDEYFKEKKSKEQREKLGLAPAPKGRSASRTPPPEPTNALQQVELEKAKQDDALSDLSDILGDLKGMAVGMGTELNKQNKALDHLHDDVEELNSRVKGANQRARRLVG